MTHTQRRVAIATYHKVKEHIKAGRYRLAYAAFKTLPVHIQMAVPLNQRELMVNYIINTGS